MIAVFLIACVALVLFVGLLMLLGRQELACRARKEAERRAVRAAPGDPPGAFAS